MRNQNVVNFTTISFLKASIVISVFTRSPISKILIALNQDWISTRIKRKCIFQLSFFLFDAESGSHCSGCSGITAWTTSLTISIQGAVMRVHPFFLLFTSVEEANWLKKLQTATLFIPEICITYNRPRIANGTLRIVLLALAAALNCQGGEVSKSPLQS